MKGVKFNTDATFNKPKKRGRLKALVSRRERRRRSLLREREERDGGDWKNVVKALPAVDQFGWLTSRIRAEVKDKGFGPKTL